MTRHVLDLDFLVGPDSSLIRLYQVFQQKSFQGRVGVENIDALDVMKSGVLGLTHVVDISSENPEGFFFKSYAPKVRLALGTDMSGRRLVSAPWKALREFGLFEYHRIKTLARPELSQVDLSAGGVVSVNRRLIVPLFGDRSKVTHLLVSIIPNQQHIVQHTLQ
jgi:hypothetical protein